MKKIGNIILTLIQYILLLIGFFLLFSSLDSLLLFSSRFVQLAVGGVLIFLAVCIMFITLKSPKTPKAQKQPEQSVEEQQPEVFVKDDKEVEESQYTANMHVVDDDIYTEEFAIEPESEGDESNEINDHQEAVDDHFETAVLTEIDEKSYKETTEELSPLKPIENNVDSLSEEVRNIADIIVEQLDNQDVETSADYRVESRELTLNIEEELSEAEMPQEEIVEEISETVNDMVQDTFEMPVFNRDIGLTDTQILYINNSESSYINEEGLPQLVVTSKMDVVNPDDSYLEETEDYQTLESLEETAFTEQTMQQSEEISILEQSANEEASESEEETIEIPAFEQLDEQLDDSIDFSSIDSIVDTQSFEQTDYQDLTEKFENFTAEFNLFEDSGQQSVVDDYEEPVVEPYEEEEFVISQEPVFDTSLRQQLAAEVKDYEPENAIDETIITPLAQFEEQHEPAPEPLKQQDTTVEEIVEEITQAVVFDETTETTPIVKVSNTTEQSIKDLIASQQRENDISDEEYFEHYEKEDRIIDILSTILMILVVATLAVGAYYLYTRYFS